MNIEQLLAPKKTGPKSDQLERIYAHISQHGCIVSEVAQALNISASSAGNHLSKLHHHKIAYICDWRPSTQGGPPLAVYRIGSEPDAPRPPTAQWRKRAAEKAKIAAAKRAAARQEKAEADAKAARAAAVRAMVRRDPLVAFLFGPAPV